MRVSEEELKDWRAKAEKEGQSLAQWIRERCNDEVMQPNVAIPTDAGRKFIADRVAVESAGIVEKAAVRGGKVEVCSHNYGAKACPIPGCENYKWRRK